MFGQPRGDPPGVVFELAGDERWQQPHRELLEQRQMQQFGVLEGEGAEWMLQPSTASSFS